MDQLLYAAKLAATELDRIDRFEFEEDRYAERRRALEELSRAIPRADQENLLLEANFLAGMEMDVREIQGTLPEAPEWLIEQSQLFLEEVANMTRDEELRMLPENTHIIFV